MATTSMSSVSEIVTSGKLYLFQEGAWSSAPKKTENVSLQVFEESAKEVVSNQEELLTHATPEKILAFVNLFNTAWTAARLAQKKIAAPPKGNDKPIQFSSFSKQYAWLSNFFKTLIFDQTRMCILPHVEAGYVAFKAEAASEKEFAREVVQEFDPATAKAYGSHLERPERALDEMRRLEELKFAQNPVLQGLLMKSGKTPLEEHTSDPFWGTAHGTFYDKNSNHLGRILQEVRANLS